METPRVSDDTRSVTAASTGVRGKRRKVVSRASSPQDVDPRIQDFQQVLTLPFVPLVDATALDSVPGIVALVGPSIGIIVVQTSVPVPFPVISRKEVAEIGASPLSVAIDPFAPRHKYVAAACHDGSVIVVSARPGYQFMQQHHLHIVCTTPAAPQDEAPRVLEPKVTAMTWTMALHASAEQLPNFDHRTGLTTPPAVPLSTNTRRALLTVDIDGRVAAMDPASGAHHICFVLRPSDCGFSSSTASWVTIAAVAYTTTTRAISPREGPTRSLSKSSSSSLEGEAGVVAAVSQMNHDPLSGVGVNVLLCDATAVVIVHCQRSARGHVISPQAWLDDERRVPVHSVVSIGKNNGALRMSSAPWSSGVCLVSRPLHRMWVIDGPAAKVVASHKLVASNGCAFDETTWGPASFAAAHVWAPQWSRSGVLRRHLVVSAPVRGACASEAPRHDRDESDFRVPPLLQLSVLVQSGADPSSWRFESNAWDTVPLPAECHGDEHKNIVGFALSACALHDTGSDVRGGDIVFTPCCFVLVGGRLLRYLLPGDIAVTPLLEALLRERYGCPIPERRTAAGSPGPDLSDVRLVTQAVATVARDTFTAAATLWRHETASSPQSPSNSRSSLFGGVRSAVVAKWASDSRASSVTPESEPSLDATSQSHVGSAVTTLSAAKRRQKAVVVYTDARALGGGAQAMALPQPESPPTPPTITPAFVMEPLPSDVETHLDALDTLREFEHRSFALCEDELGARSRLHNAEEVEWATLYGRHLQFLCSVEEKAAAIRRVQMGREAAALRWATSLQLSRELRPMSSLLREMVHRPSTIAERNLAKSILTFHSADEERLPNPAPPGRVRPWAELLAMQERDRKLFDLAELRLSQREAEYALQRSAVTVFTVYEEWTRKKEVGNAEADWQPCRAQFVLTDGTSVDMDALRREKDPTWVDSAFTVSSWRYAKRWPANSAEDADPTFWFEPASIGVSAELILSGCKVRRRLWTRRLRSVETERRVAEMKARHATEYAARVRNLFPEPLADGDMQALLSSGFMPEQ